MGPFEGDEAESAGLRTRRCQLVPVSVSLAHAILSGDIEKLHPGDGWPHADTSVGVSGVLKTAPAEVWLIRFAGRTIGDCGTHGPADESGSVEIGYGLAAPYRGRGLATEAVAALTESLAGRPGVKRVLATTAPDNVASWRVLAKVGFRRARSTPSLFEYEFPVGDDARPVAD